MNDTKRIRFMVDKHAEDRIKNAANDLGRSVSELIRIVILRSTDNLSNFSTIDTPKPVVRPRYYAIESRMKHNEQIFAIDEAARKRGRSTPTLIYLIASTATDGFTNFNIVKESTNHE